MRIRLHEAEAQLEAIRSGTSDAVVGSGGLLYREGAEKAYVAFFSAMNEGGVTLDRDGAILHCNSRFAAMLGKCLDSLRSRSFIDFVIKEDRERANGLLWSRGNGACEVSLISEESEPSPVRLSITTVKSDRQLFRCLVVTDLKERVKVERQLHQHECELRAMYSHQQSMIELERKRVAREIHDELGQILTALKMETSLLKRELIAVEGPATARIGEMFKLIESLFKGVRSIAVNLRPSTLDLGLVPAIEWLPQEFSSRWQISCAFQSCSEDIQVSENSATTIFRIIQESLTNVARHANATAVRVILDQTAETIHLEIHDNGCGFVHDDIDRIGFGMTGMRERVQELGGTLSIESELTRGCRIAISIPRAGA